MTQAVMMLSESLKDKDYRKGWRVAIKIGEKIYRGKPGENHATVAEKVLNKMSRGLSADIPWDCVITGFVVHGQWLYQWDEDRRARR